MIIASLNQKGGVGKTTLCHNLAGVMAADGLRVLMVDLDPQASLTQGIYTSDIVREMDSGRTVAAILDGLDPLPSKVIFKTSSGADLVPGSRFAKKYNVENPEDLKKGVRFALKHFIADVRDRYDYVLIDCPPNLHGCSWMALAASDRAIVPVQPEKFGFSSINDVQDSILAIISSDNPQVQILGYVISLFSRRRTLHQAYENRLRNIYGDQVFETVIPNLSEFSYATYKKLTVIEHAPKSDAADALRGFAREVCSRTGMSHSKEVA